MAEKGKMNIGHLGGVARLREENEKVVKDCESRIQHWQKVSGDYEALNERLKTLPDQLSYDIMVPFGPLAFMPGKLVHTNEVTALLGDNWFAKCSAKQAQKVVDHRMKSKLCCHARKDLETISSTKGDYVDIREDTGNDDAAVTKGKQRIARKPHSMPKMDAVLDLKEENEGGSGDGGSGNGTLTEEELWARLDELEKLEELQDEQDRLSDNADLNGEDTSSVSSEEEKEGDAAPPVNGLSLKPSWTSRPHSEAPPSADRKAGEDDEEEQEEGSCLPTIFFSHTIEPKKVRINTGKNTMFKFSERKEQKEHSKKKKKNGHNNGLSHHELHKITTPVDIYRLFVDVKNGEPVPRKSILKSRSRENSVCSDTSESSAADFEERRVIGRSFSHDEATHSDTSDDSPTAVPQHPASRFEAFSGTVVEKEPMPSAVPHLTIAPPALPTILERKQEEVTPDVVPPQQAPKRVSKFKAARLQQV
ncbi:hypothetical protein PFLUV_G00101780 [Perca fluviatilis]|uniref:Protein phosphatase 1 regulatory subunit 19 n=1 Tax=Perca fluviatilis TaxID=8168 RepID=A0A6A5FFG9_PERFL|nr:hypothetical protein PFLUV_G00101780 [Perca fluviatilis]